ncbi:MAG: hypothetical protein R6V05_00830 [Candidatus Brocadiia bacterium]
MTPTGDADDRIRPYEENPFYWQYRDEPVLLLGGSVEDNLFQIPELEQHLDLLASVGGNYVRCTMSNRDEGNVWPHARDEDSGLYDLTEWNDEYWSRFERLLELTAERDIIVQIELWDSWEFYAPFDGWGRQPYNPRNNCNYTAQESGLPEVIDYCPFERIQPFFKSVPALKDLVLVRRFQEAYVDRVLASALPYDHVLYCVDNETNADPAWPRYWAEYVRAKASEEDLRIETTEMWDNWDPSDGEVPGTMQQDESDHPFLHRSNPKVTIANPDIYTFVDISNHNPQRGQAHYETAMWVRRRLEDTGSVRPVTCVKIYGGKPTLNYSGPPEWGEERFWRNVFAGVSAVRFHRPRAGLGLSELAQAHIRSMRLLTDRMDIFRCTPRNDLLRDRRENEAYCLAAPGVEYAVCFMDGGEVGLDCSEAEGPLEVRWLEARSSAWSEPQTEQAGENLRLRAPGGGIWAALIHHGGTEDTENGN